MVISLSLVSESSLNFLNFCCISLKLISFIIALFCSASSLAFVAFLSIVSICSPSLFTPFLTPSMLSAVSLKRISVCSLNPQNYPFSTYLFISSLIFLTFYRSSLFLASNSLKLSLLTKRFKASSCLASLSISWVFLVFSSSSSNFL